MLLPVWYRVFFAEYNAFYALGIILRYHLPLEQHVLDFLATWNAGLAFTYATYFHLKGTRLKLQLGELRNDVSVAMVVGVLVTALWFCMTWRYGFDLADEGYYWYGAQRMLHGEMPMRDFMAYDIGRYAWTASVMHLSGSSGIVAARIGAALYQCCSVVVGVLIVLHAADGKFTGVAKVVFACVTALMVNVWAHPYYKVFDYGTSILIVAMLVMMFTSQSGKHWFGAGLILGLCAIMGRNHGIYGAAAALMLLCFLLAKQRAPGLLARPAGLFVAGTLLGFSPTFALCALIDGFGAGFIASILDLLSSGATNIGLPVPRPWTVDQARLGWVSWAIEVGKGLGFLSLLLVPAVAILALLRRPLAQFQRGDVLILCASFAGIAYAHYAYSRADLTHLALAIAPLLILLLSVGARLAGMTLTALVLVLLSVSCLTLAPEKVFLAKFLLGKPFETISVTNATLYVMPPIATRLKEIDRVFATIPDASERFLALPDMPGLHAIHEKKMPIWEIYALWPRNAAFESQEQARLKAAAPEVVFLSDHALDGRAEMRYSKTHPLLYQWVVGNYRPMPASPAFGSLQVFVK